MVAAELLYSESHQRPNDCQFVIFIRVEWCSRSRAGGALPTWTASSCGATRRLFAVPAWTVPDRLGKLRESTICLHEPTELQKVKEHKKNKRRGFAVAVTRTTCPATTLPRGGATGSASTAADSRGPGFTGSTTGDTPGGT
eukprot:2762429-Amphidinium_carterae.1